MKINANRRRPTLGSDPFDALVPETPPSSSRQKRKAKVRKIRSTFHLPMELLERARDAVYWTPGLTLSSLCEAGVCDQKSSTLSGSGAKPSQSGRAISRPAALSIPPNDSEKERRQSLWAAGGDSLASRPLEKDTIRMYN